MASPNPIKVLTVGSASGSIKDLFAKVKAIDAKHGKFDLVLCNGDFFGQPKDEGEEYTDDEEVMQLLNGAIDAPVECFIMQGEHPLPQPVIEKFAKTGGQLSKNVFLLHKSGVMTTAHGVRIACLGGVYDSNLYSVSESLHGFTSPYFTSQTVEKLLSNTMTSTASSTSDPKGKSYNSLAAIRASTSTSQLIDILLTNNLPANIAAFSNMPMPPTPVSEAEPISEVVRKIKPRYHFVSGVGGRDGSGPAFWEREPIVWEDENGRVMRFVSLGAFGGPSPPEGQKKQRWFYAFSIVPHISTAAPQPRPANATRNPFTEFRGVKRPLSVQGQGGEEEVNFRWSGTGRGNGNKRGRVEGGSDKPPPGYKCKICESPDHFINDCPDRAKPGEGYICKICQQPGHFVRDCPTKHQVGDTGGKKPREGYVCRACGSENHYIQDCPVAGQSHGHGQGGRRERGPPKEITTDECWFCLSNPNLAKHLIVSIGSECYVTLPKGQIIPTHSASSYPDARVPAVPGGGHVLIVPITHYPTYASIPPDLSGPIVDETERHKSALRAFYAKHHAHPLTFEVGRLSAKGGHAHVQVIPLPLSITPDEIVSAFQSEGERAGLEFKVSEAGSDVGSGIVLGERGYFRVELPDGRRMVHWLRDGAPFSIQFGRQVVVSLLGMPERFDWKECLQSEADDKADAQAFKTAFAPFDPTM